ncbi:hypothetical protein RCG23_05625 [Neobacillus sp. PS3-34]|uniref:hypothetical protein n=1 Tax=Neobacillus sp. PS3-34 TaxID=3070678 RepID=UPI0027E0F1CC|nr:hypothetical protein [Neobacillus sp. PS3-34]WML49481.1 hypothetical protein RCG23_05625 [Neobacillus sp. PS3-34]
MMYGAAIKELSGTSKEIYMVMDELDAYLETWNLSKEGDLLIFFYEKFPIVNEFLNLVNSPNHRERKKII